MVRVNVSAIILCGLPASGKTVTGEILALHLGWTFHDLDKIIVSETGLTISQIFKTQGENAFRELEKETFINVHGIQEKKVIALGGGSLENQKIHDLCSGDDVALIWLDVSPSVAAKRILENNLAATHPLLEGLSPADLLSTLYELYNVRSLRYATASVRLDVNNLMPTDSARKIISLISDET